MSMKANTPTNDGVKKHTLHANEDPKASASISQEGEFSDAELGTVTGGKATAKVSLMKSCATGSHIKEATITH